MKAKVMQNCSTRLLNGRRIRVAVIDDSALMRQMLTSILSADPDIEVVGSAPDPECARTMIKDLDPDVITLDVEMPKMDGLTFLNKIMTLRPMPVVMVSSLTKKGAETTMRALEYGAVDFVAKPTCASQDGLRELSSSLLQKVKAAAGAKVLAATQKETKPSLSKTLETRTDTRLIAIGASTGGVVAIQGILSNLPPNSPGILIAQHMPPAFTRSFAARLNQNSPLTVVEASDDDSIRPGCAYIAPGGFHMEVSRRQSGFVCRLQDGPPVSGHKPSVDVLFGSIAAEVGATAIGIILTGMGRDGANGLLMMRQAGAMTFGQDQSSCVVYGMPRAANEIGAVARELSVPEIAKEITASSHVAKGGAPRPRQLK